MSIKSSTHIRQTGNCHYVEPQIARDMQGIRVALTVGAFNPWGQAVKKMLELKGLPYVPVAQRAGESNEALMAWTGNRNAPTLVCDHSPGIVRWLDQIMFIENRTRSPALLPQASQPRATAIGVCNELAGEWGLGWCRRLMLLDMYASTRASGGESIEPPFQKCMDEYGYESGTVLAAAQRVADIMRMVTSHLKEQANKGSGFLVGTSLSVADIYWACFSNMIEPLPDDLCPISPEMRRHRTPTDPTILAAKDAILLEHRDRMFRQHLGKVEF
jgi:glutathione S-transferase